MPYLNNIENPYFQNSIANFINYRQDLQKFLLASSGIAENIQEEINLVVTDDKLNDAAVRRALDPVYKKVLGKQSPFKVVFKDISKFDTQNPITGNLVTEIESGKLTDTSIQNFFKSSTFSLR